MRFSYASPARLADIPCLDAASLRAAILTQVAHGWRVLAFFGLPRALYAQGELALVAGNMAAASPWAPPPACAASWPMTSGRNCGPPAACRWNAMRP